jgi:hypothetical protein
MAKMAGKSHLQEMSLFQASEEAMIYVLGGDAPTKMENFWGKQKSA